MIKRIFLLVLVLTVTLAVFASCAEKPVERLENAWDGKESFVPNSEMDEETKALAKRHEEYLENSSLAFSKNETTDEGLFETEEVDGGVKITAYTGNDNIVIIPEKIGGKIVVALGATSFAGLPVRAVSVPDSVAVIEKGAFENCSNIATLRVPFLGDGGDNSHFGYIFGANGYENHAIKVPSSLDMVILGGRVTEIADNAFAHCKTISAIVASDALEKIGEFAFYECRDLVYFHMPNSVREIGDYAFSYCSSLFAPSFAKAERIGFGAFYECNSIRSLMLPFVGESNTENGYIGYIFGAESADNNGEFVPKSLYVVTLAYCTEIPDRAFAGCQSIAKFIICDGIERIGVRAFYGCRSLIEIELPDSVEVIMDDAFFGCDNLAVADLGSGVESLGMQAFYGCRTLEWIKIPEKVTEIKSSTFALCSSLQLVELNNVKTIGKDAFWGCSSLGATDCNGIEIADGNGALLGEVFSE